MIGLVDKTPGNILHEIEATDGLKALAALRVSQADLDTTLGYINRVLADEEGSDAKPLQIVDGVSWPFASVSELRKKFVGAFFQGWYYTAPCQFKYTDTELPGYLYDLLHFGSMSFYFDASGNRTLATGEWTTKITCSVPTAVAEDVYTINIIQAINSANVSGNSSVSLNYCKPEYGSAKAVTTYNNVLCGTSFSRPITMEVTVQVGDMSEIINGAISTLKSEISKKFVSR